MNWIYSIRNLGISCKVDNKTKAAAQTKKEEVVVNVNKNPVEHKKIENVNESHKAELKEEGKTNSHGLDEEKSKQMDFLINHLFEIVFNEKILNHIIQNQTDLDEVSKKYHNKKVTFNLSELNIKFKQLNELNLLFSFFASILASKEMSSVIYHVHLSSLLPSKIYFTNVISKESNLNNPLTVLYSCFLIALLEQLTKKEEGSEKELNIIILFLILQVKNLDKKSMAEDSLKKIEEELAKFIVILGFTKEEVDKIEQDLMKNFEEQRKKEEEAKMKAESSHKKN